MADYYAVRAVGSAGAAANGPQDLAIAASSPAPSSAASPMASPASLLRHRRPNTFAEFVGATGEAPVAATAASSSRLRPPWSWWAAAYVADYAALVALVLAWVGSSILSPFERDFSPTDADIALPMRPPIVSSEMLVVVALVTPLVVALAALAAVGAIIAASKNATTAARRGPALAFLVRDLHAFALGLVLAVAATALFTDLTKNWVGRLRPDFLARCQWNQTLAACTGSASVIKEGRRSFPSGHASESFAGMVSLSLFLAHIWSRVFDVDHGSDGPLLGPRARIWRFILPLLPPILAFYVAISRIQQNIHNPTDVIAGALIGTVFAFLSHEYYLNARHPNMHGY